MIGSTHDGVICGLVIWAPAVIDISACQLLLKPLTGWLDRQERDVLRYLLEENRVLRLQPRGRRLQLTDGNRRPRAVRPYRFAAMPDNGVAVEQHFGSKPDAHLWYKLSVAKMSNVFVNLQVWTSGVTGAGGHSAKKIVQKADSGLHR